MNALFPILADLGLERNPYAERGLIVLAAVACLLGTISCLRWWLHPPASNLPSEEELRGWPFMKRTLKGIAQIASGIFAVFLLARLTTPGASPPAGWSSICPPHEVAALAIQGDIVWAGGKEGLFAVDRKTGALLDTPLRSRDLRGTRALLEESDTLWIGCTSGLFAWNGKQLQKMAPPSQPDTGPITALKRVRDGSLWIGATGGAWCLRGNEWRWFGATEGLQLPTVDTIFEAKDGALWLASREPEGPGFWKREGEQWKLFDHSLGLGHPAINDMLEDQHGTLWIATGFGAAGAAQRFVDGALSSVEPVPGLEGRKIRSLFEDSAKRLWFCSEYNGVAIHDGANWRRLTMKEGLPGNEIKVMKEDTDGTLWLGNERGLGRIKGFQ